MKKKVAVIGSNGAIGNSICQNLIDDDSVEEVYKFSRVIKSEDTEKIKNIEIDIEDEDSIKNCVQKLASNIKFDLIFVATGILHNDSDIFPEKSIRDISIDKLQKVLLVNTIGPTLVGKYFIPFLRKETASVVFFGSVIVTTAPFTLDPRFVYLILFLRKVDLISSTRYSDFSLSTAFVSTSNKRCEPPWRSRPRFTCFFET